MWPVLGLWLALSFLARFGLVVGFEFLGSFWAVWVVLSLWAGFGLLVGFGRWVSFRLLVGFVPFAGFGPKKLRLIGAGAWPGLDWLGG